MKTISTLLMATVISLTAFATNSDAYKKAIDLADVVILNIVPNPKRHILNLHHIIHVPNTMIPPRSQKKETH